MDGKEAIIERIIGDAEKKADALLREAENGARESAREAEEWIGEYLSAQRKLLKEECENVVSRRKTVAELDCRKVLLNAKQEVISEVFARALKRAEAFDKSKYLRIVEKLCEDNAEEGDTVVLSENAPLKEADVMSLSVAKKKKLKFGGADGRFGGGVMLVNDVCDKDLSFNAVLETHKDELEAEIAAALFV